MLLQVVLSKNIIQSCLDLFLSSLRMTYITNKIVSSKSSNKILYAYYTIYIVLASDIPKSKTKMAMIFYNKNWFYGAKFKTHKTLGDLEFGIYVL